MNPAAYEQHLPKEPLTHSYRLLAMADAINGLVKRGAKATNFMGIYCVGCDFRKLSGDHITFRTADLDAADFNGVELSSADFSHTSLVGTNFDHAILHDANFDNANEKPFFWYQSFGHDPDISGPTFRCADLTGSSFHGYLIEGYRIKKAENRWFPAPLPGGAGMSWNGAKIPRTTFENLYVYFVSTEGRITAPEVDDNSQMNFTDVLGNDRWMGLKVIGGRVYSHHQIVHNSLDTWDQVTWRTFNEVVDATDAELPERMKQEIISDTGWRERLKNECSKP